jgi:hypothetical protein
VQPDAAVAVIAQGAGSFVRVVHVTLHNGRTGNADFAFDVGIHLFGSAGLDHLIVGVGEGNTDRAAAGVILGGQAGGGNTLGGAEAFPDLLGSVVGLQ